MATKPNQMNMARRDAILSRGRIVQCDMSTGADPSREITIAIQPSLENQTAQLIVYVNVGLLAQWKRMEEDVDAFMAGRKKPSWCSSGKDFSRCRSKDIPIFCPCF